ncbi:MAG: histidine kinase [Acidobacteriaceae bacterium]
MSDPGVRRAKPDFWLLQLGGWTLYGLATAISYIPFRHVREEVAYRIAFLCTTFLASFVVHFLCRSLWQRSTPLSSAMFYSVLLSYVLGVLCTALSAVIALHFAGDRQPVSWTMVAARAFEAAIVLIAWSALYFGIKHYAMAEDQKARLLASEASAREAQLQALRYQLQPHFLFNTLNAISSLVVSQQPKLATQMIAKLGGLLRSSLSFPEVHAVTLREELSLTEEYLSIEQVRFGPRLAVALSVSPETYEAQVPRFLLQPLVENAIRHGISHCPRGGEIAIRAWAEEERLQIQVENDRSEETTRPGEGRGEGLGLANTRARLEKLYGERGNISISGGHQGRFLISLSFPLVRESSLPLAGSKP